MLIAIELENRTERQTGLGRTIVKATATAARAELERVLGCSGRGRRAIDQLTCGEREQVTVGSLRVRYSIAA